MSLFYSAISAFLTGIALHSVSAAPFSAFLLPGALGIGFLIAYAFSRAAPYAAAGVCLLMLFFGAARVQLAPRELPAAFVPLLDAKQSFTGEVAGDPDVREKNVRAVVSVSFGGASTRVLAVLPPHTQVAYGDSVRIEGKFKRPKPFEGDGGRTFRYDHYLMKDGVFALVQPATAEILAPPSGFSRAFGALYALKDSFARGLENAIPEPEAGLAEGLVTGGKQGLAAPLLDAFTTAGIVQIVVLSGYNVAIVAEAIMRGLSWLPKRAAMGSAALGIVAFVIAAGSGSSAVRAAVMACLALFAKASGRTYDVLRALTLTIALMALWNPFTLTFDPSFQLSALATYGLILGVPVVEPWLGWIGNAQVRDAVCTTISAELAVLPLLLWQTGNLSLVSVPANVLVSFIVPGAMAASALAGAAGMVMPILPLSFARLVGLPAFALLWIIVRSAEWVASLPFAQVQLPAFSWIGILVAYAAEAWLGRLTTLARARSAPRRRSS